MIRLILIGLLGPTALSAAVFECKFEHVANPKESKENTEPLSLVYVEGSDGVTLVGNNGTSSVGKISGYSGVTFAEVLASGVVQTTTIALNGEAVHSRHTIIGDILAPSQFYGRCVITE